MEDVADKQIPIEKTIDSTIALKNEGYLFIKNRCEQFQADLFETRLFGEKVICMSGEEAAKQFYDASKFERKNTAPKRVQKTLFGENAIQGMDGEGHLHRKQLFMSLMDKPNQDALSSLVMEKLAEHIIIWENAENIILFDEARDILCEAACQWAGIPLGNDEISKKAEEFAAMVDSFGSVGPRHWKGRTSRNKSEEWIRQIISNVRLGKHNAEPGTALHAMAHYRDLNGKMLDENMAAIELINVIRPIVAISTYITFLATALHDNPQYKQILLNSDSKHMEMFAEEVRRFYPFTPFVGARVKQDFHWNNCDFVKGSLVLLDVYGMNHDARIWDLPDSFLPERFENWKGNPYTFIPQGGGDPTAGHRCPGEGMTVEIMKTALSFLINKIEYQMPEQDLSFSLASIPTLPESKVILSGIKGK